MREREKRRGRKVFPVEQRFFCGVAGRIWSRWGLLVSNGVPAAFVDVASVPETECGVPLRCIGFASMQETH